MGDAYPHQGAPERAEAQIPISGNGVRWTGGEISSVHAQS
jgi:hypothetical protein